MELKNYQKEVIGDLSRYLDLMNQTKDYVSAYKILWEEKGVPVKANGLLPYQDILPGVPNLCFKVPTGGGKTFFACNSIKPIFDALPFTKIKPWCGWCPLMLFWYRPWLHCKIPTILTVKKLM